VRWWACHSPTGYQGYSPRRACARKIHVDAFLPAGITHTHTHTHTHAHARTNTQTHAQARKNVKKGECEGKGEVCEGEKGSVEKGKDESREKLHRGDSREEEGRGEGERVKKGKVVNIIECKEEEGRGDETCKKMIAARAAVMKEEVRQTRRAKARGARGKSTQARSRSPTSSPGAAGRYRCH
jgi:hypothetical protein